jgi:predicted small secreted protein
MSQRGIQRNINKIMKSIIKLSAITFLAAFALAGCDQNTSSGSTDASTTNSSMGSTGGTIGGNNSLPATNSLPGMNTNLPASTNQ